MFTIELHHGGKFTKFPGTRYIEGSVRHIDMVDIDEFSMHEMDAIMAELGYTVPPVIYYHFRLPNGDFDFGLRALGNDDDVRNLGRYVRDNKLIRVYTEHGETKLLTYFMSPEGAKRVTIEEITDEETQKVHSMQPDTALTLYSFGSTTPEFSRVRGWKPTTGTSSCSKRLCLDWLDQPTIDEGGVKPHEEHMDEGGTECHQEVRLDNMDEGGSEDHEILNLDQMEEGGTNAQKNSGLEQMDEGGTKDHQQTPPEHMNNVMEDFLNAELMKGIEGFDPFVENMEDFLDEENFNVEDMCVDNEAEGGEKVQDFLDEETVNLEDMCFDNEAEDGENLEDFFDEENMVSDVHVDMDDFDITIETDEHVLVRDNTMTTNVDVEDEAEDIEVIDNEEWDSFGDESDNDSKRKRIMKNLGKDKTCSEGHVHKPSFHVGQQYKSKKELKDRIDTHALETRRNLTFSKNDKFRLTAFCAGNLPDVNGDRAGGSSKVKKVKSKVKVKEVNEVGKGKCCWKLHASRATEDDDWVVKTYNHNHICLQSRDIKLCTATFISKQIMDQVESNPEIPVRALQDQLQKKYEVALSIDKVFRAKAAATKIVVGDYTKQYAILRDYILELQATNPETTARVDVYSEPNPSSPTRQFKRIYVCLGALKKGFKAGMRDFLGLDGTFMKGPFPGQVLTAVGVDSNNGIYPLAYAIVEAENTSSWKWFLDCLGEDLDLHANSNFTFISDRQKVNPFHSFNFFNICC